jgi:hypothetical protein
MMRKGFQTAGWNFKFLVKVSVERLAKLQIRRDDIFYKLPHTYLSVHNATLDAESYIGHAAHPHWLRS